MGNAGAEAAATAVSGAVEDGPGAAAEVGTEKASGMTTATGKIPMPALEEEEEAAAAGGAAGDRPGAPPATTHGLVAEVLNEEEECNVDMGNAAEASEATAAAAAEVRPPRPANWAEATAGEAMDLDGLSTAAPAAAPPRVTTHGPAAEALLEGAECDAEMWRRLRRRRMRRRECGRQDQATGMI